MAKKKVIKSAPAKKSTAAKSISKALSKSVGKLTQKLAAVVNKPAKKVEKKAEKPAKKLAPAKEVKASKEGKSSKVAVKEQNSGDTLIEMARAEMAAVKIGQTAEKVEKASKLKSIKVERGNLADEKAKWQELNKRYGKEKATPYKMSESYESSKPVQHKVLGWGFVLTNDNDRLEVLFENGIKMLISNYKPN